MSDQIKSLFYKAISQAEQYSGPTNTTKNDHTSVIFHLPFHPNDPPSYKIQQAWRETIALLKSKSGKVRQTDCRAEI